MRRDRQLLHATAGRLDTLAAARVRSLQRDRRPMSDLMLATARLMFWGLLLLVLLAILGAAGILVPVLVVGAILVALFALIRGRG